MSVSLNVNGVTFNYPEARDQKWGPDATDWAVAVTSGMLQKAGGLFQLLAEADFGSGYGLKSLYYKSRTANPASTGQLRLARTDLISWRNEANDADVSLYLDSSNNLIFNGNPIVGSISVDDTDTIDLTLDASVLTADIVPLSINNGLVALDAAIAYSKLNLSGSITNGDISGTAAIAYSKLNLSGSIANSDISDSAAIAFSKLAALNSAQILVGSAGNVATAVAVTGDISLSNTGVTAYSGVVPKDKGGTGADNSSVVFPSSGIIPITDQVYGFGTCSNLGIACSVSGNDLTISLKQGDGSSDPSATNPVTIGFPTSGTGTASFVTLAVTSALSVTVPSGATLGLNSGSNGFIYIYAVDVSGSVILGVNSVLVPDGPYNLSALGTGSDSAAASCYTSSGSAGRTRVIARIGYNTCPNGSYGTPDSVVIGNQSSLRLTPNTNGYLFAAISSTKTMSATNTWASMTGNSVTLQPGTWRLAGDVFFFNNGTVTYTSTVAGYCGGNGGDNATLPTTLGSLSGVGILSAYSGSAAAGIPGVNLTTSPGSQAGLCMPSIVISLDRSTTIYIVPYALMTTAANSRVTVAINAEFIN